MATQTLPLTDSVYHYLLQNSLHEPAVLAQLRQHTIATLPASVAIMQISPEQGQFMAFLVELIAARKTLEIGVFTGYSALAVANALPTDGKLIACDINKEWTDIAQQFWQQAGVRDKIDLRLASALHTLDQLLSEGQANSFDFAFIDADKKGYDAYYEKTLQLLRCGGLMALDNVLQQGRVADPDCQEEAVQAIRALNQKIHADQRVSSCMIAMGDGLTLVRKK